MTRIVCLLVALLIGLTAALGCNGPTAVYDRNRSLILGSQGRLIDGDKALSVGRAGRAADYYAQAASDLGTAIAELEEADREVSQKIRDLDAAGAPQTGGVGGTKFYTDILAGYREAQALAIVLKALASERQGEAAYRLGAQCLIDGDQAYAANQFATAKKEFSDSEQYFARAVASFTGTLDFLQARNDAIQRLARSASLETWGVLAPLRQNVSQRLIQAGDYRKAAAQRHLQAAHIVSIYRRENTGNLPPVEIVPLIPLPDSVRTGAIPPPVPSATLAK
jgi:hypothetical protein